MRANKLTDVFKQINMMNGDINVCWPFTGVLNKDGRPYFTYQGKKYLAYRVTYELLKGEELGTRVARHTCDNERCCNPHHIIPGTHQENMDDMKQRERHGLPHHTVRAIKKLLKIGRKHQEIADLYGVSRTVIAEISSGRNYAHVKEDEYGESDDGV